MLKKNLQSLIFYHNDPETNTDQVNAGLEGDISTMNGLKVGCFETKNTHELTFFLINNIFSVLYFFSFLLFLMSVKREAHGNSKDISENYSKMAKKVCLSSLNTPSRYTRWEVEERSNNYYGKTLMEKQKNYKWKKVNKRKLTEKIINKNKKKIL